MKKKGKTLQNILIGIGIIGTIGIIGLVLSNSYFNTQHFSADLTTTSSSNGTSSSNPTSSSNGTSSSNSTSSSNGTSSSNPTSSSNGTSSSNPTSSSNGTSSSNPTSSSNGISSSNPTSSSNGTSSSNSTSSSNGTSSSNHASSYEEAKPVRIEKGYVLGGKILYKNTTKRISIGLTSENPINTTQSIEVEMVQGRIGPENYDDSFENKRFILKEAIHSSEVSKIMENYGGKNWAAVYMDVLIPDYPSSQMPEGDYTLVITVHRNNNYQSQIFLPVKLLDFPISCDINGDGFENMIDLVLTLKIMNGEILPSQKEKNKIDKNKNGILDLTDTMKIFKCVLNPKEEESKYFENECKDSVNPIEILLCPTGNSAQIRHIEHTPPPTEHTNHQENENSSNEGDENNSHSNDSSENNDCNQEGLNPIDRFLLGC